MKATDTTTRRAEIHRLIRESGNGERLDRLITMLDGHKAKLADAVQIAQARGGRGAAAIVSDAERALRAIETTLDLPELNPGFGSLGHWGPNGQAGRVDALLASAHRLEAE